MAYQLFSLPRATLLADAVLQPGWKVYFFATLTTTPVDVYTTSALNVAHTQPVEADAAGVLPVVYLNSTVVYKASVYDQFNVFKYTVDPVNDSILSSEVIATTLDSLKRTAAEIAAGVTPTNYAYPPGNVLRYGAVGDGATDDSLAFQRAIDVAGGGCVYVPGANPIKTYQLNSTLNLHEGTILWGESATSVIMNWAAGITGLDFNPSGFSEYRGQHIWDLTLQADTVLQINRTSTLVANGVSPSFVVGGSMRRCRLYQITTNTGYGVMGSCLFDWVFEENKFAGTFDIAMVLQGSDLNTIRNNRFTGFRSYGIVDRSAALSFGSSNDICHNDFTLQSNTNATFILSSSLYPIIHHNYLEQIGSGTGVGIAVELINPAGVNFGANVQSRSRGIYIVDNRIEAEDKFSACIRIDPSESETIICRNPSSAANLGSSLFTTTGNLVPLVYNGNNGTPTEVDIIGASWGVWDGFKSAGGAKANGAGFSIDGTSNKCFRALSQTSDGMFRANIIVIPAAVVAGNIIRFCPNAVSNTHFPNGVTITVTVYARTLSSADTLIGGFNSSTFDSGTTNLTLTNQFKKFTFTFTGPVAAATDASISFSRSTNNGDIEIAAASWTN